MDDGEHRAQAGGVGVDEDDLVDWSTLSDRADKGKFPGSGLLPVCGPEQIGMVITNRGADADTLALLAEAGTQVVTV